MSGQYICLYCRNVMMGGNQLFFLERLCRRFICAKHNIYWNEGKYFDNQWQFSRLFTINCIISNNHYNNFQAVYNIRGSGNEVNSVLMRIAMTSQVHNTQQTPFQIYLPFNQTKTARDLFVLRNTITITITNIYKYKYILFSDVRRASTQTVPHFQVPSHHS